MRMLSSPEPQLGPSRTSAQASHSSNKATTSRSTLDIHNSHGRRQDDTPSSESEGSSSDSGDTGAGPEVYFVDKILDDKIWHTGERRWLVQWLGYGPEENSWEPRSSFVGTADDVIERYERKKAEKKLQKKQGRPSPSSHKSSKPSSSGSTSSRRRSASPAKHKSKSKSSSSSKLTVTTKNKGKGRQHSDKDDSEISSSEEDTPLVEVAAKKKLKRGSKPAPATVVAPSPSPRGTPSNVPIALTDSPPSPTALPTTEPAQTGAQAPVAIDPAPLADEAASKAPTVVEVSIPNLQPPPIAPSASTDSSAISALKRGRLFDGDAVESDPEELAGSQQKMNKVTDDRASVNGSGAKQSLEIRGVATGRVNGAAAKNSSIAAPSLKGTATRATLPSSAANIASSAFNTMQKHNNLINGLSSRRVVRASGSAAPSGSTNSHTPQPNAREGSESSSSTSTSVAGVDQRLTTGVSTSQGAPGQTVIASTSGGPARTNGATVVAPHARSVWDQSRPSESTDTVRSYSPEEAKPSIASQAMHLGGYIPQSLAQAAASGVVGPFTVQRSNFVRPPQPRSERSVDPRQRGDAAGPVQPARPRVRSNSLAPDVEPIDPAIFETAFTAIKKSALYERHRGAFDKLPFAAAAAKLIGMSPTLATELCGHACFLIDGPDEIDSQAETQAMGAVMSAVGCRPPTDTGEAERPRVDFLFIHRHGQILPGHSEALMKWTRESPAVRIFVFGDKQPVAPTCEYGFEIVPTMSSLWETEARDSFLEFFESYKETSKMSIHPRTITAARVVDLKIASALIQSMKSHEIGLVQHSRLVPDSGLPNCDEASLLSLDPEKQDQIPAIEVDAELERRDLIFALSPVINTDRFLWTYRRKVMVNDRVTLSIEKEANATGVEVMTWNQLHSAMIKSGF